MALPSITFRRGLFGFNKQDVYNYIESLAADRNNFKQECESLTQKLEEAMMYKRRCEALEQKLDDTLKVVNEAISGVSEADAQIRLVGSDAQTNHIDTINNAITAFEEFDSEFAKLANKASDISVRMKNDLNELNERINAVPVQTQDSLDKLHNVLSSLETIKDRGNV